MRLGGQISASIEVLEDVFGRHRPASVALNDWGRSHRFAGSRDRSVIGTLVYDALRRKASLGWHMGADTPRALAIGVLHFVWGLPVEEIAALCDGSQHAPEPLNDDEQRRLRDADISQLVDAPGWVQADMPEWLFAKIEAEFPENAIQQGRGLSERAPIDLRVNMLKADRERVLKALARYGAEPTPISPFGIRIEAPGPREKNPNVEAEAGHGKGWFELQDEASQIALMLSGASARQQLLDLCAGAGGKTLGFAALMQNTGQIHAYDSDKTRLRPIFERLKRSAARNVQVLPAGGVNALDGLRDRMDVVFVDAPCTGSGVWRRRPDAKWRLSPEALGERIKEQREVLATGAGFVKPGGQLIYATCSVLPDENGQQTDWFLQNHPDFEPYDWRDAWRENGYGEPLPEAASSGTALQLAPAIHGTDGFYISILKRPA